MEEPYEDRVIEVRLRQMIRELDALARRKNARAQGFGPPPDMPPFPGPGEPPIPDPGSMIAGTPFPNDPHDGRIPPPDADPHSPGMGRLLNLLCQTDGTAQIDLARALRIRPQSLSELLCRMEQKGYIRRTPSETDRRQIIVHITDTGRQKAQEMREIHRRAAIALFAPLSDTEKKTMEMLLTKVIANAAAEEENR